MTANTKQRPAPIERASTAPPVHVDEELRRYDEHLRDMRGLTSGTRRNYVRVAGCLLHRKFTDDAVDPSKLRPTDVHGGAVGQRQTSNKPELN